MKARSRAITTMASTAAFWCVVPAAAQVARPGSFGACAICHKVDKDQPSGVGPNLWGVGGRAAGKLPKYAYSPALAKSGIVWTRQELIAFIINPRAKVPGTKMVFAGQPSAAEAGKIADYLVSLR